MTGLVTVLLLAVPAGVLVWLMLGGPADRILAPRSGVDRRAAPRDRRYRMAYTPKRRAAAAFVPPAEPAVVELGGGLVMESAGVVVPETDAPVAAAPAREEPEEMVSAAALAMGESRVVARLEQTPAFRAAAMTPASRAAIGTPLAEEVPPPAEE